MNIKLEDVPAVLYMCFIENLPYRKNLLLYAIISLFYHAFFHSDSLVMFLKFLLAHLGKMFRWH